jgi:hypothetical protein
VERVTGCIIERQQCIVTCRDVSAALIAVESLIQKPEGCSGALRLPTLPNICGGIGVSDDQAIRAVLFEQDNPVGEVIPPFASFRPWYRRPQKKARPSLSRLQSRFRVSARPWFHRR